MSEAPASPPPQPYSRTPKRGLQLLLRLTICAALMAWIFHAIFMYELHRVLSPEDWTTLSRVERWHIAWTRGPAQLAGMLSQIRPVSLFLSLVVMGLILLVGVARWRMVLRVQGLALPWLRAIEISLVAHFFNSFLLGSTGGDVMRAIYAARETQHKKTEAVVTVFVDRILGLWALLLFGCLMMLPNLPLLRNHYRLRVLCFVVIAMTLACSGVVLLALRQGVSRRWAGAREFIRRLPKGERLEQSLDACRQFGRSPLLIGRVLATSMFLNLLCVLHVQILAEGLHMPISPVLTSLLVPVITAIIALPITPNGLGIRENLFVYLLCAPAVGVDATAAFSLSLLAYGGSMIWSVIGGIVYLLFRRKHHLTEVTQEIET